MLVGFAIKFVGTVMDLAIPWILSHIIDEVAPTGSRGTVWLWGGAMALCSALALLGNVIANRRASAVSRDVTRTLRHDLFAKVERLSAKQMDQTTVPSLISRLTTDSYNVNQDPRHIQRLGVRAPISLLGGVTRLADAGLPAQSGAAGHAASAGAERRAHLPAGYSALCAGAAGGGRHGAHRARRRRRRAGHPRPVQGRYRVRPLRPWTAKPSAGSRFTPTR